MVVVRADKRNLIGAYNIFKESGQAKAMSLTGGTDYDTGSDMTVINNALASGVKGRYQFDGSEYNVDTPLLGQSSIIMDGDAMSDAASGTRFKATSAVADMFDFREQTKFGIYNIMLDGNSLATDGLDASSSTTTRNLARLDKLTVQGCLGDGVDFSRMEDSTIFDCLLLKNDVNMRWSQGGSSCRIAATTFGRATTTSVVIGGTKFTFSDDCVFTQFTSPAAAPSNAVIAVDAFVSILNLKDTWFESPGGTLIKTESGITLQHLNADGVYMALGASATAINITGRIISLKNWKLETNDATQIAGLTTIGGGNKQILVAGFTTAGSPVPTMFGTLTTPHRVTIVQNQQGDNFNPNLFPSHRAL